MLEGAKQDEADPRCLDKREIPAAFLRLQSAREQVALPYSSLIKLALKTDETALELSFVTHRVTITGKNLSEIYKAITEVEARLMTGQCIVEIAAHARRHPEVGKHPATALGIDPAPPLGNREQRAGGMRFVVDHGPNRVRPP